MSEHIRVRYEQGDRFEIQIRQHTLTVDQPVHDGGDDSAATPTELFVASAAACIAFYARRYLARHGLSTEGLAVDSGFVMASSPSRVGEIRVRLHLPPDVPEERHAALLAVVRRCTVHNSLEHPPTVVVEAVPGLARIT